MAMRLKVLDPADVFARTTEILLALGRQALDQQQTGGHLVVGREG